MKLRELLSATGTSELEIALLQMVAKQEGEMRRALDHFDTRHELYTNDADVAAGMADILRAALSAKEQ